MTRVRSKRQPQDPLVAALRQRRLDLWLTMEELAGRMHLQGKRVWEFELGCPNPTLWSVRRFAEALDCDVVLVPRSPAPEVTDEMAGVRPRKGRAVQEEALHLSGRGLSASVIAGRLGVSSRTVVRWRTEANRRRSEDAA